MVLSDDNLTSTAGNESSSVVRKIHNMTWLKQATGLKNFDQGSTAGEAMSESRYKPLANLTEDGEVISEKKSRRRSSKKSRSSKPKSDVSPGIKIIVKCTDTVGGLNGRRADDLVTKDCQLSIAGAQSGVGQGVWRTDQNAVEALFPGAMETASTEQIEEEQIKMALAASLETAFLEKCVIDPPVEPHVEPAKLSDEENIWVGEHKNLPTPDVKVETVVKNFDANNNSGSNESRSSCVPTRKSENKVASCQDSKPAVNDDGKTEASLTPVFEPHFIDKFGRADGYTEKRIFMGKGGRAKEEKYRQQRQQQHESSTSGPNQRPRHVISSQDSRSRNSRQSANNSHTQNRSSGYASNDRQRYSVSSNEPRRSVCNRPIGNNSRNDNNGPSVEAVVADLNHHFAHTPKAPYRQNEYPTVEDDPRNARQQGRVSKHASQDARHNYREPFDSTKKNLCKYTRESNDRSADDRNGKKSGESDAEHENRTDNDTNRGDSEKNINPLMSMIVERPSNVAAAVQETSKESLMPIDRPIVESNREAPIKMEPRLSQKETNESSREQAKPHVQLSDFNSRFKAQQEQAMLSTNEMSSSCAAPTTVSAGIVDASCRTGGLQFSPACFSVPPPGFACLDNGRNSSNATYVLPVDSSQIGSAYRAPVESSCTSSDYDRQAESSSDSSAEIKDMDAVWARLKMLDPMLYDFIQKKFEHQASKSVFPTTPETRDDQPIDVRSLQDPQTLQSYDPPVEQRRQTETLNPNAKQYSPISKQNWISQNQLDPISCYSMPPSYEPHAGVYCHDVSTAHDIHRQDNFGWPCDRGEQFYGLPHPAHHQPHYANETIDEYPVVGRQSYMVSEQNLASKSAQPPTNSPASNDDYALRYRTFGFNNVSTDPQRQVQYPASHHQCGVAPGQFYMHCDASYGGQSRPMNKCYNCAPPPIPLQQYMDIRAQRPNRPINANPGNQCHSTENIEQIRGFVPQGRVAREPNSISKMEHNFVQPIIPPMSFSEKATLRGRGRGIERRGNNQ